MIGFKQKIISTIRYGCGWNIRNKLLPAKALKLLENVLELKLRKLQKIILKLVTTFTLTLRSLTITTIGPLHDLVTWYGINYAEMQITQWEF